MEPSPPAQQGSSPGTEGSVATTPRALPGCAVPPPATTRVLWAPRDLPPLGPDVSGDLPRYRAWAREREAQRLASAADPPPAPAIDLLVVVDRPDPGRLRDCLAAVAGQTSPAWRLLLSVVDDLDQAVVRSALARSEAVARTLRGQGPLPARVAGLAAAGTSPAFCVVGQHDVLAPDAVALLAAALGGADLAYADEDRLDGTRDVATPVLKPDWSPELLLSWPYIGRPAAYRAETVAAVGGVQMVDGDWEHDLTLRLAERGARVAHVAEVLCHRSGEPPCEEGPGAVVAALERRKVAASVEPGPVPRSWRVCRRVPARTSVSAIIPFRDAPVLLRACVDSVSATVANEDMELVLVDNGSTEPETLTLLEHLGTMEHLRVLRDDRPFNWAALNNAAARVARGDVLLFLNNDIEAAVPGWLEALAAQALRAEVGAVGARLVYPGGRLQHAGVVLGLGGAAGHVLAGLEGDRPGYMGMAVLARDCSAVTGACLATRREVFDALGGFDETLGLDLNDVDYCLRAQGRGWRVVYEPSAELVHHESPSRGTSGSPEDQGRFLARWQEVVVAGDPFFSPHLTRMDCSAALREPDEDEEWLRWRSNLPM